MSNITHRLRLTALSAAICAVNSGAIYAQQDNSSVKQDQEVIEEVTVTGIRGALQRSIDDKRNAKNITDTVNAEDMGKTTDQNIADSLGRVTGVTVVSRDGEGSSVTVRGATAAQNTITLNGQQLTSTDFSQSVDLSSFSADILSKLEVVKTPSADHDEGSLGASINLETVRPLNQREDSRSITVQGRYNDFANEADHKLQISATQKFLDDTLGVAFSAYDETNTYRKDQYRVENFIASPEIASATDQNGEIVSGIKAIYHQNTGYELHQNSSDRQGMTLGVQWAPSEDTELMLDTTYSKQEQVRSLDALKTRYPGNANFVEGKKPLGDLRPAASFTDPQADWYSVDTRTNTMTKMINRFGAGDMTRSEGGDDQENASASLKLKQTLTDRFRMEAQVGYSESTSESLPNAYAALQNYKNIPASQLFDAGADIEPVGYDCTSGRCAQVFGNSFVDFGDQLLDETIDGVLVPGYEDNIVKTGFNPLDTDTFHLAFLSETDVTVEDTLQNAQVDFDFDLDTFGITTIEFGAKVTQREKMVDNQRYQFNSVTKTEVVTDKNGNPVAVPGGALLDVTASLVARDGLDYNDFMSSLGYGRDNATKGWLPIDARAAVGLVLDDENTLRTPNDTESRTTDIDTEAFYLKTNFSFLDERLTGDIGVRYVKTEVESKGYAGADFWQFSESLEREFDLVKLRELRDTSLPECRPYSTATPASRPGYESKFERVDGLGWDTSSGSDPAGWTPIPDQGPCHDPDYAAWVAYQQNPTLPDPGVTINWLTMWRYADVSTTRENGWGSPISYDGTTPIASNSANQFNFENLTNKELQSFAANGSHTYSNVLPSLNLNYAFRDDLVGRFAISKTMTRPEIDQLRPGFQVVENGYWASGDTGSKVSMYNTKLDPLESRNIDVSLEWYFTESGMLSVAVFNKDMTNFTDVESAKTYISDLRNVDGPVDASTLIKLPTDDAANDYGLQDCMPLRATADYGWWATDLNRFSSDARDLCAQYSVNKIINGKGATITGVELGYSQSYDFLPGYFLSGLGMSANYTYQDSEYEPDKSTIDPTKSLPAFPVADTPEHSYNLTAYWEQDGHQVRLSYRGSSDSLVGTDYNTGLQGRTWNQGSIWNEGRDTLDFSATYAFSENMDFTFQATNLTDAVYRTYFTSRELEVQRVYSADNANGYEYVAYEEGNPLDGEATKSRTYTEYKVGATFRLGVRVNF